MTVIVTGSRSWADYKALYAALDRVRPRPSRVVQGGANGADRIARAWCKYRGVECITVDAEWGKYGKRAGPIRNRAMLDRFPDAHVIACPSPHGRGTQDCMGAAKERGMNVEVIAGEQGDD